VRTFRVLLLLGAACAANAAPASVAVTSTANADCTYSISPASVVVDAGEHSGNVSVTAGSGCRWGAWSDTTWITGWYDEGNWTVLYFVAANPSTNQRTGTLTIAGLKFTVTQTGAPFVKGLSFTPPTVVGGGKDARGTVTLNQPAPRGGERRRAVD